MMKLPCFHLSLEDDMDRFIRQYSLNGFGLEKQQKLASAKILVVGAGGLGCPALLYLAAAGIGHIGVADGDQVSLSNLNRQVIFGEQDLGKPKVEVVQSYFSKKYSDLQIEIYPFYLTQENSLDIISRYDVVIDGSDNFQTRYMVNDACYLLEKPLIMGSIFQNEGQVSVLNGKGKTCPNYRDIFPEPPEAHEVPNCSETGVLGVLPGIIGTFQAAEAIKLLAGFGQTLSGKLLVYDLLSQISNVFDVGINEASRALIPKSEKEFLEMDYSLSCGTVQEISWDNAVEMLTQQDNLLVDIREDHEQPKIKEIEHMKIPMAEVETKLDQFAQQDRILICCQSGIRSLKTAQKLSGQLIGKEFYSVKGGVNALPEKYLHND
ncbi:HesA/MoeB/ThiF family protein [Litoribacter ruber]|nr:HesA/MoeB/ThiF family protein [Litoribacter alkaliphilus]